MENTTVGARSFSNGIEFYSNKRKGYYSKVIVLKEEIATEILKGTFMFRRFPKTTRTRLISLAIAILVALFINSNLDYNLKVVIGVISVWLFIITYYGIKRIIANLKKDDVYRFHSAEHMVLNAYLKLGRTPSLEEAAKFSRFHIFCGTTVLVVVLILISSIVLLITFLSNILVIIVAFILTVIITMYLWANGYLSFLQFIVTIPLGESELELKVSVKGLSSMIEFENQN